MRIALFGISYNPASKDALQKLFDAMYETHVEIHIYTNFYRLIKNEIEYKGEIHPFSEHQQVCGCVDYFFSIGGDGTLLSTVQIVRDSGIPILGINTGRLGYLTSASLDDIKQILLALSSGNVQVEKRSLLRIDTKEKLFGDANFALNDFTIHKKDSSSMIIIHAHVNGVFLNSYWGDGLIVSTPTGSTAYSLSCGGPIVAPDCGVVVISPIAPHNLNVRPLVVSSESIITLTAETRYQNYLATIDSRSLSVDTPVEFIICKESFNVNIIKFSGQNFAATIRGKLLWGSDVRN